MAAVEPESDFRADMSARVVESFRGPWAPYGESICDEGVALDTAANLRPHYGPTVLRVVTTRPAAQFKLIGEVRNVVEGDWLCDPEWEGENVRLPTPRWGYDEDSKVWSRSRELVDAWEECEEPQWMLRAAGDAGVGLRLLTRAAVSCARAVVHLVPDQQRGRSLALDALAVADRWADGRATDEELTARSHAIPTVFRGMPDLGPRSAANAVQYATSLVEHWNAAADPTGAAAMAAAHAGMYSARAALAAAQTGREASRALAEARMPGDELRDAQRSMADGVRAIIPTVTYLRSVRDSVVPWGDAPRQARGWSDRTTVRR